MFEGDLEVKVQHDRKGLRAYSRVALTLHSPFALLPLTMPATVPPAAAPSIANNSTTTTTTNITGRSPKILRSSRSLTGSGHNASVEADHWEIGKACTGGSGGSVFDDILLDKDQRTASG